MNLSIFNSEARQQKRIDKTIIKNANHISQTIESGEMAGKPLAFEIGRAPQGITVMEFAKQVGEKAISSDLSHIASLDLSATAVANSLKVGVGVDGLDQEQSSSCGLVVVYERTNLAEFYGW